MLVAGVQADSRRVAGLLTKAGHRVKRVRSWTQVLARLGELDGGILLLEPDLKGMGLLEGLRLVRKTAPQVVSLVLGPAPTDTAGRALEAGAAGLLPPDIPPEVLLDWLGSYTLRQRLRRENESLREQIHQSESYLARILDQLEDGIITTNLSGDVLTANRAAHQLLRFSPGSLRQQDLARLPCAGPGPANLKAAAFEALEAGNLEGRFLLTPANGSPLPVFLRGTAYRRDLEVAGAILAIRDLTAQEELELRLEEHERLSALGRIAQGIAHEVRNPLMAVGGLLRRLERHLPPDNPGRNYLPGIQEGVQRLERMVQEIDEYLVYAQASGRHRHEVDLTAILESALRRLRAQLDLTAVRLEVSPLPPLILRGDAASLEELFYQLLRNGVEAMDQGGVLLLKAHEADGMAVVAISDCGRGIAPEHLPHLSHPFFTTKMTGAGMGLTKVHMIAGRHRGAVEVESHAHVGATFTVRLPMET